MLKLYHLVVNCQYATPLKEFDYTNKYRQNRTLLIMTIYKGYLLNDNFNNFAGHDIVASFIVNKSVPVLEDNKLQLEADIFDEIEAPAATQVHLSLNSFL